jgi:carboxyl-terminal processing protease
MKNKRLVIVGTIGFILLLCAFVSAPLCQEEEELPGGIGIKIYQLYDQTSDNHKGQIVVVDVYKNSPAEKHGIQRGDIITSLDGRPTAGMDLRYLLTRELRGLAGTDIKLTIKRVRTNQVLRFAITRIPWKY